MTIEPRLLAALLVLAGFVWGVSALLAYFVGRAAGFRHGISVGKDVAIREMELSIGRRPDA